MCVGKFSPRKRFIRRFYIKLILIPLLDERMSDDILVRVRPIFNNPLAQSLWDESKLYILVKGENDLEKLEFLENLRKKTIPELPAILEHVEVKDKEIMKVIHVEELEAQNIKEYLKEHKE